jgi:Tfp pilus assembly PilM family ATPase
LALQGLGRAALDVNLIPGRGGMLGRWMSKRARAAWGIDVGSGSVKAVRLSWDEKRARPVFEQAVLNEHKKTLGQVGADGEDAMVEESLLALFAQHEMKGQRVCIGLPGRNVLTRQFRLPKADPSRLLAMVQHEARLQVPLRLEDLAWGYACLFEVEKQPSRKKAAPRGTGNVLFVAVKSTVVEKRVGLFRRLGVRAEMAQSECLALANLVIHEFFAERPQENKEKTAAKDAATDQPSTPDAEAPAAEAQPDSVLPLAVVDVGSEGGHLIVCSPREFRLRHLGAGGHLITRALIKELNLTVAQAQQLQRNPDRAPSVSRIYKVLQPIFDDLLAEIQTSLEILSRPETLPRLQRMLAAGGMFQFHGLLRFLRSGR